MKTVYGYGCSIEQFNENVSKYLSDNLGIPMVCYHDGTIEQINYSNEKGDITANVKVRVEGTHRLIDRINLDTHLQISLKLPFGDFNNPIKKGLERALDKK